MKMQTGPAILQVGIAVLSEPETIMARLWETLWILVLVPWMVLGRSELSQGTGGIQGEGTACQEEGQEGRKYGLSLSARVE